MLPPVLNRMRGGVLGTNCHPFSDRLPEVVLEVATEIGVPTLCAAEEFLQAAVLVVEQRRRHDVSQCVVLPGEVVDDHLVGIAIQLQPQHLGRGLQRDETDGDLGCEFSARRREGIDARDGEHRHGRVPRAPSPEVAGQGEHEQDTPLHLQTVVELSEVGLRDVGARPGAGDASCERAHLAGLDAGDRFGLLRGVALESSLQLLEDRRDADRAFERLDIEDALQGGLDRPEFQVAPGCLDDAFRDGVEHEEPVVGAVRLQIARAQEAPIVHAYQQRHVGLFDHECGLVELLFDDDLRHRERQRGIGSDVDRYPFVGVDRRGVEVGRDADDVGALVARLVDEVRVRDVRVVRIAAPDQDQVAVEEIVHGTREDDLAGGRGDTGRVVAHLGGVLEDRRVE